MVDAEAPDYMREALSYSEEMVDWHVIYEYEHRYIDIRFPVLRCLVCRNEVEHQLVEDRYLGRRETECSDCHAQLQI